MKQNQLLDIIAEGFEEHSHEEDALDHRVERSEQERIKSLKQHFLLNDITNIYMPNSTIANINQRNIMCFGDKLEAEDYQGSYILRTNNSENFKKNASLVLPNGFIGLSNIDSFNYWLPITSLFRYAGVAVLVSLVFVIIFYRIFVKYYLYKKDSYTKRFIVWGRSFSDIIRGAS